MQQTIFRFGLITFQPSVRDRETTRVQNDILFDLDQNLQETETITQQTKRYEEELFPYGIAFLGIGFVLIILGTMMN